MKREQILGAWTLVSFEAVDLDTSQTVLPLGPNARGVIMYTDEGYMSAQLMNPDRADHIALDGGGPLEQAAGIVSGYLAYSGPFEVNESSAVVRHHVELSLVPAWVGGTQIRQAVLEDGCLTLSTETTSAGRVVRSTLTWQRPSRTETASQASS